VAPSATCGCSRGRVRSSIEANDLFISVQWHQFSVQVMQAFLTSAALVGVAESATRRSYFPLFWQRDFARPYPIIAGILSATLLNHALAGSVGVWLADMVPRPALNWLVSLACIGFGVWALRTDALDNIPLRTGQAHS
jgi:putative Ca2+/H+ antiporter (TMEM165/GDT1 family)